MITVQEVKDAWVRLMRLDGWQQAYGDQVTFRSQIIDGVQFIDFQGSVEIVDWKMDFNIWPQSWYHGGYYKAFYNNACNDIGFRLDLPAIISGYSCGGAFALIAMTEVCDLIRAPVKIIAFATPRVAWIKQLGIAPNIEIVNVQTYGDPVVHLPPKIFGYVDNPGLRLFIGGQQPKLSIKQHWPETYSKALSKL